MPYKRTSNDGRSVERENRLAKVAKDYLQGHTNTRTLAAKYGKCHTTIERDIREILSRMREESPKELIVLVGRRIAQLEKVMQTFWIEFERSRQREEQITTTFSFDKCEECDGSGMEGETEEWCGYCDGKGKVGKEVVTRKETGRVGDPAHLNGVKNCVLECAKLEGCNPQKDWKDGAPSYHAHLHQGNGKEGEEVDVELIVMKMKALQMAKDEVIDVKVIDVKVERE